MTPTEVSDTSALGIFREYSVDEEDDFKKCFQYIIHDDDSISIFSDLPDRELDQMLEAVVRTHMFAKTGSEYAQ